MKLKQWLKEYHNMTYAQYKELPEEERGELHWQHQAFCASEQKIANARQKANWRPMTDEEREEGNTMMEKEAARYEMNLKIGGIDERGNYTALHHRWDV